MGTQHVHTPHSELGRTAARCPDAGKPRGQQQRKGRSWQRDESGPGRPTVSRPGLADVREEKGKGGVQT